MSAPGVGLARFLWEAVTANPQFLLAGPGTCPRAHRHIAALWDHEQRVEFVQLEPSIAWRGDYRRLRPGLSLSAPRGGGLRVDVWRPLNVSAVHDDGLTITALTVWRLDD